MEAKKKKKKSTVFSNPVEHMLHQLIFLKTQPHKDIISEKEKIKSTEKRREKTTTWNLEL